MPISAKFLFVALFFVGNAYCNAVHKPKIAIIGAGIGGASASHFLTELLDGELEIDIYESKTVGGRLATIAVGNNTYEAGGSIIHSRNKYMKDFAKLLGLEERPTSESLMGIWNGGEFVFTESNWKIVTLAKLLYRYGIQPIKLHRYINTILNKFDNIYQRQDDGMAYESFVDLLSGMDPGFPSLLEVSTAAHLQAQGFSKDVIDELVEATLVVNYGQNTDIQSFVGFVSVAGAGADLWAVKGGNKEVPMHLIYRNNKVSVVPSQVSKIRYLSNEKSLPQYELSYNNAGSENVMKNTYDVVIIATPLTEDQKNHISFEGFPKNAALKFSGKYQTTVATFVEGDINPSYFGLEESLDAILSCNPNETKIHSVGKLFPVDGPTENNSRTWKIFSKERLLPSDISAMFSHVDQVHAIPWKAYPKYSVNPRSDKFRLFDSLYHVNAIEWAASAMEMSAIGGRNVALLVYNQLISCCLDSTVTDKTNCKCSCKKQTSPNKAQNVEL
ncbi:prenylcysteine oxidase 1-like [Athalia rosae]|uniref:prenylcysteine oxidase 1-like n=1 Tax=Athalia rosae TaxID=37344 RepID=UPI0020349FF5|nr:prenylcysteine oxidase 1-like [Athalia rosae]